MKTAVNLNFSLRTINSPLCHATTANHTPCWTEMNLFFTTVIKCFNLLKFKCKAWCLSKTFLLITQQSKFSILLFCCCFSEETWKICIFCGICFSWKTWRISFFYKMLRRNKRIVLLTLSTSIHLPLEMRSLASAYFWSKYALPFSSIRPMLYMYSPKSIMDTGSTKGAPRMIPLRFMRTAGSSWFSLWIL